MPQKDKYSAVIIGAGRIASSFDSPAGKSVLTHAHAYRKHPDVKLLGFYDTSARVAQRAVKTWGGQSVQYLARGKRGCS